MTKEDAIYIRERCLDKALAVAGHIPEKWDDARIVALAKTFEAYVLGDAPKPTEVRKAA